MLEYMDNQNINKEYQFLIYLIAKITLNYEQYIRYYEQYIRYSEQYTIYIVYCMQYYNYYFID